MKRILYLSQGMLFRVAVIIVVGVARSDPSRGVGRAVTLDVAGHRRGVVGQRFTKLG